MPEPVSWNWPAVAAVVIFLSVLATFACKANPGCPLMAFSQPEPPQSASPHGEEEMSATLASARVHHANDATFRDLVLKAPVPVLVDFYADWCGPCQRLGPVLEELAAELPTARIVKVNVDQSPSLAVEYGVESIPSLKVFKQGRVTDALVGLAGKRQLRAMLSH